MILRRAGVAVAAVVALIAVPACSSDDGPSVSAPSTTSSSSPATSTSEPSTSSASSSSSSSSPASTSAAIARDDYQVGECLDTQTRYAKVDCSSPHVLEVVAVVDDDRDGSDLVKRAARATATCNTEGASYLGSTALAVTRVAVNPLPSSANSAAATKIVCVAAEYRTSLSGYVSRTASLKGALHGNSFWNYNMCVKEKASEDKITFVSCSQPHASEAVGGRLNGKAGDAFPGNDKIQSEALKFCKPVGQRFLKGNRSDIVVSQNSGGETPWKRGQMLTGCFVQVTSGTVTKSLRDIGDRPLSDYR
ncbi:septum formation family protein [Dermacoccaceae bacterium W4C1]